MSCDGLDDSPRNHEVTVTALRQVVLNHMEYSYAPAPSASSRISTSPRHPISGTLTPSERPKDTPKNQHPPKRRSKSNPQALRSKTTNGASMRKTLVENVKESLKEIKAMRASKVGDSASRSSEANIGLGSSGASLSSEIQMDSGSSCDAEIVDEDSRSSKNELHSARAESSATWTSEMQETEEHCPVNLTPECDLTVVETQLPGALSNLCVEAEKELGVEVPLPAASQLESDPALSEVPTATSDSDETLADAGKSQKILEKGPWPSKLRKRLMRSLSELDSKFELDSNDVQAAREAFLRYDQDGDGELNVSEFGKLLRDQGLNVNYKEALEAIEIVSGQQDSAVDFDSFQQLFADAMRDEKLAAKRRHGFSADEAEFLHSVFDKYDVNHTHKLEGFELSRFLQDISNAPKSTEEQSRLRHQLEQVRGGVLGPLTFKQFLAFVRLLEMEYQTEEEKQKEEAAKCAGLSKQEVEQLKEVFDAQVQDQDTLSCSQVYEILRHGLHLHAGEGQHELKVRGIVEAHAMNKDVALGVNFLGFLGVIGDVAAEEGGSLVQDPSPMNISKFEIRSITSAVVPITAFLKLQKSKK